MSSDSSSSTSGDDSADRIHDPTSPKSFEDRFASVTLAEPHAELASAAVQESRNGVGFASASADDEEGQVDGAEEEIRGDSGAAGGLAEAEEGLGLGLGGGRGGVVWGRTNSELEADAPASPSSSGYAGERGSSGVSSGGELEIDEVGEDEIQEVRSDAPAVDGVLDSQASWVPGKRHVDEVFRISNSSLLCFFFIHVCICTKIFISDPRMKGFRCSALKHGVFDRGLKNVYIEFRIRVVSTLSLLGFAELVE